MWEEGEGEGEGGHVMFTIQYSTWVVMYSVYLCMYVPFYLRCDVYLTFLTPADWDVLRGGEGSCSSSPGTKKVHTHKHIRPSTC